MPTLTLNLSGANGLAHNWSHVSTPLNEITTWANTTKLDYVNIQTNGLRTTLIASHANIQGRRAKIRNTSGATLNANDIVACNGSYDDGTDTYPTVVKADSAAPGSWIPADGIIEASVSNNADGYISQDFELVSIDTSGQTLHDPVYLDTTAGGYTLTAPAAPNVIQIIGRVTKVDASAGRILFSFPGIVVPYSLLQEVISI